MMESNSIVKGGSMKLRSLITLGLAVAAVAVPVAQAGNSDSYIGHPGGPGAAGPVLPEYNGVPLDRDLVGGPGGAGPVLSVPARSTGGGFDWADAAVGGGFVAGIALLAAAAAMLVRGRREPAHLHS
jgi:hypothetical protein